MGREEKLIWYFFCCCWFSLFKGGEGRVRWKGKERERRENVVVDMRDSSPELRRGEQVRTRDEIRVESGRGKLE